MGLFAQTYETTTLVVTTDTGSSAAWFGLGLYFFVLLALMVVMIIAMWKIFTKAGEKGWKSIIPFYNTWVLLEISGKPGWWLFLMFIPFVNIVIVVLLSLALAKSFGKSEVFGIFGLWIFSAIGYLILGFGGAKYQGPEGVDQGGSQAPTPAAN